VSQACPIPLDHGVIGNGRVLALVSPTMHIDWMCMPRFDASVFGRILDVIGDGASAILLRTNASLAYLESGQPIRFDESFYFAVSYGKPSDGDSVASAQRMRDLTISEMLEARDARFRAWS
jgi:hypothetical protein